MWFVSSNQKFLGLGFVSCVIISNCNYRVQTRLPNKPPLASFLLPNRSLLRLVSAWRSSRAVPAANGRLAFVVVSSWELSFCGASSRISLEKRCPMPMKNNEWKWKQMREVTRSHKLSPTPRATHQCTMHQSSVLRTHCGFEDPRSLSRSFLAIFKLLQLPKSVAGFQG